jgi:hypothetical protein
MNNVSNKVETLFFYYDFSFFIASVIATSYWIVRTILIIHLGFIFLEGITTQFSKVPGIVIL